MNADLKKEWKEYLEQTQNHERIVRDLFEAFGLDPEEDTPGRKVVRHIGESLVKAMEMALDSGTPEAAQLVAAECVILAETKDHQNWELIGEVAKKLKGDEAKALKELTRKSRTKKTSTCTTRWAGPVSCGSNRSVCRQ